MQKTQCPLWAQGPLFGWIEECPLLAQKPTFSVHRRPPEAAAKSGDWKSLPITFYLTQAGALEANSLLMESHKRGLEHESVDDRWAIYDGIGAYLDGARRRLHSVATKQLHAPSDGVDLLWRSNCGLRRCADLLCLLPGKVQKEMMGFGAHIHFPLETGHQ